MTEKEKTENGLIINIPIQLKNLIKDSFTNYSEKQLNKIYFLIYKINSSGNYQIHIRNHSYMFGWKTGITSSIIQKLIKLEIIKLTSEYSVGATSNEYSMVQNYDGKSNNNCKIFYYDSQTDLPIWVQKYIADGYTVKAKEYSNYKRTASISKTVQVDNTIALNNELRAEIADLKRQLASKENLYVLAEKDVASKPVTPAALTKQEPALAPAPVYSSNTSRMTVKILTQVWKDYDLIIVKGQGVDKLRFDDAEILKQSSTWVELKTNSSSRTLTINDYIYSKAFITTEITV